MSLQENTKWIVHNNVYSCVTDLVEMLLSTNYYSIEDFLNWDIEENIEAEPLEYWIVSDWLAEKLACHGEMILERGLGDIWGRTISGQSICIDGVIEEIAKETFKD